MAFDSFQALMHMQGHGVYVWTCYAVFFVLMALLAIWSVRQRAQLIRRQQRQSALDARQTTRGQSHGGGIVKTGEFTPINQTRT
ncbi:heme exporter protein CcmD [Marinobacter salicampi]|uniref:heme exporter protein CcmD n=1 Tax=Marinobacter salicampi TaxID=435907 RepID=UPI00140E2575|nr:heme exporter protein CcmD [Marinobacter salicampi]